MANDYISQVTLPNNVTYDINDTTKLSLTGGRVTGDVTLYTSGTGNTPALIFQREDSLGGSYYDWRILNTGGKLTFQDAGSHTSNAWTTRFEMYTDTLSGKFSGSLSGNATSATSAKYLMNRGGDTVTIADSSWAIQITPSGHTNRATVFTQNWKQSDLTYTPSGGSATTNTDTADLRLWLSSSNTSNSLQVNMQIDGRIYALGGFQGNLTGTASALSNFKVTTTSNLGIDAPGTNAIGYVSGLTKAAWNYQQIDGSLYTQFYNTSWISEIFQDYRTGQLSVRGKNNGTWQSWRRILDETNGATILGLGTFATKSSLAWNEITQSGADSLNQGSSDVTASTEILTSYASNNGFSDTNGKGIVYRRAASKVVNATLVKAALGTVTTTAKKFLKDTGAWAQVDWEDLTGKPTSFTPSDHTHSHLVSKATINSGEASPNNNFRLALKKYFDDNKTTVPRNNLINFYSSAYGNGSEVFGYYLSGYDNNPYGGFFIAHYDTPRYVGILGGTYTESKLARIDIGNTITSGQIMISDGTDGKIKSSGYTIATSVPTNALFTDTNKYHKTGSWGGTNNLTYTATAVNSADALAFTLPTASTSAYGVTKLSAAADNSSLAATAKSVYDLGQTVTGLLAAADAMIFKGTLGTGGTITALPATHNAGWTYRVITAGTWAGKYCEVGTLIICIKDGTAAADADWTSVETNEDGAVISSSTDPVDNTIVRYDGTTGRIIQKSGVSIDDSNNMTIGGTIYFGGNTSSGKSILGFSSTYPKYGIWYKDDTNDIMSFSSSGNADSGINADLGIQSGKIYNKGNIMSHTGNSTGSVGGTNGPVYVDGGQIKACTTYANASVNYATSAGSAAGITTAGTTAQFWRGDNSWSNTIKQTAAAALGIDTNAKIGTAIKDIHISLGSGSGTGINDGNGGGITIGTDTSSYGGIYWQTSGAYGTRMHFATTNSFANGAYTRMIIDSSGNIGIGTLSPSSKLHLSGGLFKITANSNTVTIGSANANWCHIQSGKTFYFNPSVCIDGDCYPYTNNARSLGTSDNKWASVYATTFYGTLSGTATTATYLSNIGRQTSMDIDLGTSTYNSKVFISYADGSTTTNKPASNSMIFNVAWDNVNNNHYGAQIALHNSGTPHLQIRGCTNGTWDTTWLTVLDSNNTYAANSNGTAVSVSRNTDTTIATINGVAVKIKIPASDNTWRPIGTGASDAMAGNTNVNNVSQGTTTTSNWRKVLLSGQDYAAYNTAVGNDQNTVTYRAVGVSVQPSTGSLQISGDFKLGVSSSTILREGKSINWNQANTYAMIRMTSVSGWSPLLAMKSHSGWWTMGHYEANGYYDYLLFTFLNDKDVSGTSGAVNHMDYEVRLIPTIHSNQSTATTQRAFVTAPWANSKAAVGGTTTPIYINDSGVATALSYTISKSVPADAVFTDHYAWSDITGKPIELGAHSGALNSNGWKTMGARSNGAKIHIAYNNNKANWNSETYSASLVFGCSDTKGLLDCGQNSPIVTFGGSSVAGGTDNDPKWYFKLSGTSGKTYTFPSDSKTLCATDGSNASGSWGISVTGSSASCTGLSAKATADGDGNTISSTYLKLSGGTLTGTLYINNTTDAAGTGDTGALIVGNKAGANIAIDDNEVMARNNKATSTLYLNNDGGLVSIGSGGLSTSGKLETTSWLRVVNNSSSNTDDALVYISNTSSNDWTMKMINSTSNYGLYIEGTGSNLLQVGTNTILKINDNATAANRLIDMKGLLCLNRETNSVFGRISFYKPAYYTWITYMSNVGNGLAPTGGKPGTLGDVTGWAMRSLIEQNQGHGWIWESATNAAATANTTETKVRMSLSSYTGRLRIAPDASSTTNETAGLIIDGAKNASSGNVAIELWRGNNASWQIANEGGNLYFRNNWTTAKQTTYTQTSININYNTGNTTFAGAIIAGTRMVTTQPSSLTAVTRLQITPYFHTGGPWYIKSEDDSAAYLTLYYGSTCLMKVKHDGTQGIDWKGNASTATTATNLSAAPTIASGGTATVTLSANTAYTLTVGGKSVVFKTPSDANTNTLVNYTLATTTKAYLMACQNAPTSTTTARAAHGDTGVYLTSTAGQLSATSYSINDGTNEKARLQWNSTDSSIDFVFA